MKYFVPQKEKGFTLIETLVAVSVLLIAVAAVFTAAQSGLSSSSALRNRITATYLAEEAVDGIKNLKDTNLLQILHGDSISWLQGIEGCTEASPCGYDILGNNGYGALDDCADLEQCKVKMAAFGSDPTVRYRQMSISENNSSTVDTGFVRTIWVEQTLADKEAKITVEVSRPDISSFKPFSIETYIYNYWPATP